MSCCGSNIDAGGIACTSGQFARLNKAEEFTRLGVPQADGSVHYTLSSPSIHCGNCIGTIERAIGKLEGVEEVRVNLTLRRIALRLSSANQSILPVIDELEALGYPVMPVDADANTASSGHGSELLKALAVAGFAAMNVMLLSVSAWSGADGATRDLFHLISALIAIPAVAYSGQVFFRSAWGALRRGRLNMDVPISLAVILAVAMSLYETLNHGEEAYFDAAVSLLFFLLIGRYLDQMMRERARNAVIALGRLAVRGANVVLSDGQARYQAIDEIEAGMRLRILPGERIPVDGIILSGSTDLDLSLVTGENLPVTLGKGAEVQAGTHNLTGAIEIEATRPASASYLAEVSQMLGAAERGRGNYVRIADRMAEIYAPAVHLLAAIAFAFWMYVGGDWHASLYVAISVLIITCPCALGLAVPVVHVIAATRLFEDGILVKDGSALERLAEIDSAVFDKTGTLTRPVPEISSAPFTSTLEEQLARSLAVLSAHPASRALANHLSDRSVLPIEGAREQAGLGVEASYAGRRIRLGRASWVSEISRQDNADDSEGLAFAIEGSPRTFCEIREEIRPDAQHAITALEEGGIISEILSGDRHESVAAIAAKLGVERFRAQQQPAGKIARIEELKAAGLHPLMVGDGLNDAPCLAAGHASMAPASASDIGRAAADFVFTRESLDAVPFAYGVARKARTLVIQNFGLAIAYNVIAVPLAFAGYVTPLFAAVAMSLSSIVVVTNSLRLTRFGRNSKKAVTARDERRPGSRLAAHTS